MGQVRVRGEALLPALARPPKPSMRPSRLSGLVGAFRRSTTLAVCAGILGASALGIASCANDDQVLAVVEDDEAGPPTVIPDGGSKTDAPGVGCGNGVLEPGEGCDDGNATSGDGCSATCVVENAPDGGGACPGSAIALVPQGDRRIGSVSSTTANASSSFDSTTCGGGNGKDLVYSITSDVAGVGRVVLDAQFDAILSARTTCASSATELGCHTTPVGGGKTELRFPVAKNVPTFVVVDGLAGKSGSFKLDVEIGATICGDGVAQYPEQCDDGNVAAGDGCSASCQLEGGDPGVGKCPGIGYPFTGSAAGPKTVSFGGDVSLLSNTMGTFGCSSIAGGADQAYAITPSIDGALTAVLTAGYAEAALHVRRECFSSTTEVDCAMQPEAAVPLRMSFPVHAQQTYTIFVDSKTGAKFPTGGGYTLDVTLSPATCGNGILETPEACDDGNVADGDGCSATCALEAEPAGLNGCPGALITFAGPVDGPLTYKTTASTASHNALVKSCETTNSRKDSTYAVVPPFNGYLTAKAKGAFNLSLDLRSNCLPEGSATTTGSLSCSKASGGNGEEAVAGPVAAGTTYYVIVDGPSSDTNKEGPYTIDMLIEKAVCGNGRIEGGEGCDDGATEDGDGCTATCQLEPTPTTRTTCVTADELPLTESAPGVFTATTKSGNWHMPASKGYFAAPCAGAGKEVLYTVTPPIDGVLVAATSEASYNISLGARGVCIDPPTNTSSGGFLACSDSRVPGAERIAFPVQANTKYWIIVDSPSPASMGRFKLDVSVKAESCGDTIVGGAEECDDGNFVAGDGCDPTCKLEAIAGTNTCPGYALALAGVGTAPRGKTITVSTTALTSEYAGTCGGVGRDAVVAVTSDITGTMLARLKTQWPSVFYAREKCVDSTTQLGCAKADPTKPADTTRELSFAVTAGTPTYFFVDSLSGGTGPATLSLTVTP